MEQMNCLEWNLRFWKVNNTYTLYYNSDHVIALDYDTNNPINYLPLVSFGEEYFIEAFNLNSRLKVKQLLLEYFKYKELVWFY